MTRTKLTLVLVLTTALLTTAIGATAAGALPRPPAPRPGSGTIVLPPPPPPQPPAWHVQLVKLDQPKAAPVGTMTADRYWIPTPVAARVVGPTTIWDPVPAGSSGVTNGEFTFPPTPLPPYDTMALRVHEDGSAGSLCRTRPVSALPPTDTPPLHLLVVSPITNSADDLNTMVASVKGLQPRPANMPNVTVYIIETTLIPQATGLQLQLKGLLGVGAWTFYFDYQLPLALAPVNGTDVNQVLSVQTAGDATMHMLWWSAKPAAGDGIIAMVQAAFEPQLRSTVLAKARQLTNDSVLSTHDVRWWTDQGFTVSIRQVDYSTAGITVHAALCRLN